MSVDALDESEDTERPVLRRSRILDSVSSRTRFLRGTFVGEANGDTVVNDYSRELLSIVCQTG